MIDTLLKQMPRLQPPAFWAELGLRPGQYFVLTLHRPANVDSEQQLLQMLQAISDGTAGLHWSVCWLELMITKILQRRSAWPAAPR